MTAQILDGNNMEHWYALIRDCQIAQEVNLSETVEHYLVAMLMRHIDHTELLESILAIEFLNSQQQPTQQRKVKLQVVGDKCLLLSGLFPGFVAKRNVTEDYLISLGRTAYHHLHEHSHNSNHHYSLYFELAHQFIPAKSTLAAIRHVPQSQSYRFIQKYLKQLKKPFE